MMQQMIIKEHGTQEPPILAAVEAEGFKVFRRGHWNLNIIIARNPQGQPNEFDDFLHVCYRRMGEWREDVFRCTADPGKYWLGRPMRTAGTAIWKHPQQSRGAFTIGMHKGEYKCLRQVKPIKVWRDANRDEVHDMGGDEHDAWAIQIHRASAYRTSTVVNKWSAGCCVVADPAAFEVFMGLCNLQVRQGWGSSFTVTCLEGKWL